MKRIVLHLPLMNLWSEQTAATESETSFSNHFFCKPPSGGPYCAKQFSENKPSLCWLHDSTQSNISEKRAAIFSPFHTHLWADQPTVAKRLISVPAGTERQYYSICQVCSGWAAGCVKASLPANDFRQYCFPSCIRTAIQHHQNLCTVPTEDERIKFNFFSWWKWREKFVWAETKDQTERAATKKGTSESTSRPSPSHSRTTLTNFLKPTWP